MRKATTDQSNRIASTIVPTGEVVGMASAPAATRSEAVASRNELLPGVVDAT
jgi:hypothetical protein